MSVTVFFVLVVVGAVLIAASFLFERLPAESQTKTSEAHMPDPLDNPPLPVRWDEEQIRLVTRRYQAQPTVITHYIDSVLRRFVDNQNQQTAQVRIQFLRTVLEATKLSKELEVARDDLNLHEKEREIRLLELDLKRDDLRARADKEQELRDLRHEAATLKEKLEVARLRNQLNQQEAELSPATSKLSPQQEKEKNKQAAEERIARLKAEKAQAMARESNEVDRRRKENLYDDAIAKAEEQWARYL